MQHSVETEKLNGHFSRHGKVLGENDRMSKVSDEELFTFPYNLIGWLKIK